MTKKDIIKRLTNAQLDAHERESLCQLLHYLHAEGLNSTGGDRSRKHPHPRKRRQKK